MFLYFYRVWWRRKVIITSHLAAISIEKTKEFEFYFRWCIPNVSANRKNYSNNFLFIMFSIFIFIFNHIIFFLLSLYSFEKFFYIFLFFFIGKKLRSLNQEKNFKYERKSVLFINNSIFFSDNNKKGRFSILSGERRKNLFTVFCIFSVRSWFIYKI